MSSLEFSATYALIWNKVLMNFDIKFIRKGVSVNTPNSESFQYCKWNSESQVLSMELKFFIKGMTTNAFFLSIINIKINFNYSIVWMEVLLNASDNWTFMRFLCIRNISGLNNCAVLLICFLVLYKSSLSKFMSVHPVLPVRLLRLHLLIKIDWLIATIFLQK